MRIGVVLPSFAQRADAALGAATEAEEAGIDGVFCYDHLWPLGQPDRPALAPFPLLGHITRRTSRVHVGTLVARVGLVPERVLMSEFAALSCLAPRRVIAGLGIADRGSAAENEAYGVPLGPVDLRRAELGRCASSLARAGLAVWVGGASTATRAIAEHNGVAVNLWNALPVSIAAQAARSEVTWAGTVPKGVDPNRLDEHTNQMTDFLGELASAGASWAVFAWPVSPQVLAACAEGVVPGR